MTEWSMIGGAGIVAALSALLTLVIQTWRSRREAGDEDHERHDNLTETDKARLWKRVEDLEGENRLTRSTHARELAELRTEINVLRDRLTVAERRADSAELQVKTLLAQLNEAEFDGRGLA